DAGHLPRGRAEACESDTSALRCLLEGSLHRLRALLSLVESLRRLGGVADDTNAEDRRFSGGHARSLSRAGLVLHSRCSVEHEAEHRLQVEVVFRDQDARRDAGLDRQAADQFAYGSAGMSSPRPSTSGVSSASLSRISTSTTLTTFASCPSRNWSNVTFWSMTPS